MRSWIVAAFCILIPVIGKAQDLTWLVEQSPAISGVLTKILEKAPSFSSTVEFQAVGRADQGKSVAIGSVEFRDRNMRWEAKLSNINSAQLSTQARSAIRQINGDQFLLLTRSDKHTNYLVLSGAQACLVSALPTISLSLLKGPVVRENIAGRICQKSKYLAVLSGQSTNQVLVWKAPDGKQVPVRVLVTQGDQSFQIDFRDVRFRNIGAERLQIPGGLAEYNTIEDLIQSVLITKMKKKMGLE